jgi:hypothetical protein
MQRDARLRNVGQQTKAEIERSEMALKLLKRKSDEFNSWTRAAGPD